MLFLLLFCFGSASCAGGGGFSVSPPIIAAAGNDAFILFPVQQNNGTPYSVGGSSRGSVAVQWKQSDGSTVLLVKPKRGNLVFYLDGRRIGAKEADPVIPDGVVVPNTPPKTPEQAKEVVSVEPVTPVSFP